jgi:hypothetical protein
MDAGKVVCARSCANTAIASPKARGRLASRRTSFHRRCAYPRATYLLDAALAQPLLVHVLAPMAKKDDTVSKRLAEEIALAKRIKENPPSPSLLDLATPDQLNELAASLWLNEKDPVFGSVSRAFKAFGLDHRNNSDWYSLVARLARVLFPIRRPGEKKWTAERLFLLLAQVASYKRKQPKPSDTAICSWLLNSYPDETLEALRRALQDARNPKRNSELAQLADLVARSATGNRTRAVDEAATVQAVSWVIENADVLWIEFWGPRK